MKYKNYDAAVRFDDETETFYGEVINTRDVVTFHGRSVAELKREFKNSVEDYLQFCEERGEEPAKPFGQFFLRIFTRSAPALFISSKLQGRSINSVSRSISKVRRIELAIKMDGKR